MFNFRTNSSVTISYTVMPLKTGSFKIRGAYYCLSRLSAADRARGVVTASAGNHAQGIALGARLTGVQATVFMPLQASIAKIEATRGYGADVKLAGAVFDEAVAAAQAFAAETGALFVSAFDHDDIIAGAAMHVVVEVHDTADSEVLTVPPAGKDIGSIAQCAPSHRSANGWASPPMSP